MQSLIKSMTEVQRLKNNPSAYAVSDYKWADGIHSAS